MRQLSHLRKVQSFGALSLYSRPSRTVRSLFFLLGWDDSFAPSFKVDALRRTAVDWSNASTRTVELEAVRFEEAREERRDGVGSA